MVHGASLAGREMRDRPIWWVRRGLENCACARRESCG